MFYGCFLSWDCEYVPEDIFDTLSNTWVFDKTIRYTSYRGARYSENKKVFLKHPRIICDASYCLTLKCERCGRIGNNKQIRMWYLFNVPLNIKTILNKEDCSMNGYFCWSCRNKLYPLSKKFEEAYKLKKQIEKLMRNKKKLFETPNQEIIAIFN